MPSFRYLLYFFVLISIVNAIKLDSNCTNTADCGAPGTKCEGGICQCDTPWYLPCQTSRCDLNVAFVYEGSACRDIGNCLANAACINNTCKCMLGFTPNNGLCYKSLNTTCSSSNECWSNECRDSVCKCPLGSEPRGDNLRCKKTLAKLSANWTIANATGEFCYGDAYNPGCQDVHAVCVNVSLNRGSFCQCAFPFEANYQKQQCELKQYPGPLSPSKTELPAVTCGSCKDPNALCISVNQTTCWCRSGFSKSDDNTCGTSRRTVIFPNSNDISFHTYAASNYSVDGNGSTTVVSGGLRVCAPGYQYVNQNTPCQPIVPKWDDDNFEYGVCTQIDSNGTPQQENGLCPAPLTCQLRRDKHVCSCGLNQYLDNNGINCSLFLEQTLPNPSSGTCPPNAKINGSQCLCSPYNLYRTSDDKRRCELTLNSVESASCQVGESNFNQTCATLYGEYSSFCNRGQCQCISGKSFYSTDTGRCVTFLDVNTANSTNCPANAGENGGLCKCNAGYRAKTNQECERKVNQLYDSSNLPTTSTAGDINIADCQALYPNALIRVHNNACVCVDGTYSSGSTCVFFLEYTLSSGSDSQYCPSNSDGNTQQCICSDGYKNDGYNRTCVPLTTTVYEYNTTTTENITGINDNGCRKLFGNAAKASQTNGHCECLETTLAFWSNSRCFFLVETTQTSPTSQNTCPPTSEPNTPTCKCLAGYSATADKRGCTPKNISSQNLQAIDPTIFAPCDASNTDGDCEGLYGSGAICRNNTCYCDRSRSFVRNQQCVLFSKYVFPGSHERASFTCSSDKDCDTDADQKNIECGYTNSDNHYKVCKCKAGYLLNPDDSTCVLNRCPSQCQDNAECRGYTCVCKVGYYLNPSGQCVQQLPLKLHESCNTTAWNTVSNDGDLFCSTACTRAQCSPSYRDDGSRCIKYTFDDSCQHMPSLCTDLSRYSSCNRDENKCACFPGFYRSNSGSICARAVNTYCLNDDDCGDLGECLGNMCKCKAGRREQQTTDSDGRTITRCINGVGQLRFSLIFFLFSILARLIFA